MNEKEGFNKKIVIIMGFSEENLKGIVIALLSSGFIGGSFIIKKKGLKRVAAASGVRDGVGGFSYLLEPLWWLGMITRYPNSSWVWMPSADRRVVLSSKLLRKLFHLDEGDVCSSCNLRSSCEKAYLITNKEDEAKTSDTIRVLLTYGFDPLNGLVVNDALLKKKFVTTVVRKLLHEVVKLSAVPIDLNLPPPIMKMRPPKVKQPPPPKKRVGRDDIEMKK